MMNGEEPKNGAGQDELAYRVAYLIAGFIKETLSTEEHIELDNWVCASMDNQKIFENLTDPENLDSWLKWKEKLPEKEVLSRLKGRIKFSQPRKNGVIRTFWPYAAAACILLLAGIYFEARYRNAGKNEISNQVKVKDIEPGSDRAILTLNDGDRIVLDSAKNGTVISQGNVKVVKNGDGLLSYVAIGAEASGNSVQYNTLTVPVGGQYRLQLPDGTRVWLNASSSIRYPTAFHGETRDVQLTGEGYFEVKKDALHPFIVNSGSNQVRVLGTHFNVNAYSDNQATVVTLAEGSVRLNGKTTLKPGESGAVDRAGNISVVKADLEASLAWKDGQFVFNGTPIQSIMQQISHWYDAKIIYQDNIEDHFNAHIPRNVPVSKVLYLLEATGSVHFKIEEKTITVMK
jgi:transmembrane sensor